VVTAEEWLRAPELSAVGTARVGQPSDAIDEVVPRLVITPDTAEHLAQTLAWASNQHAATVLRGGGTKLGWGNVPSSIDLIVDTSRLSALVAHRHGDLTATIQAGARLSDIQPLLARQGQWLPIDSAFDAATIGGIVATNDAGPLRHRHGTMRDLVIGITLALTDGRVVKAGGHVVKNVAGYDLGKLMSGSHGTLAAIVDATFKLMPLPAISRTVVVRYGDADALAHDVAAIAGSQLEPAAFDVRAVLSSSARQYELAALFATSPAAVDAQVTRVREMISGASETLSGAQESQYWAAQVGDVWAGDGLVLRFGWLPASLAAALHLLEDVQRSAGATMTFTGRAGVGAGFVNVQAGEAMQRSLVQRFRTAGNPVGNVVVLRSSAALKKEVGVWGTAASAAGVERALKKMFDPVGILNAGRGPI
jgi:glycolate oxidase FAD binding subunit